MAGIMDEDAGLSAGELLERIAGFYRGGPRMSDLYADREWDLPDMYAMFKGMLKEDSEAGAGIIRSVAFITLALDSMRAGLPHDHGSASDERSVIYTKMLDAGRVVRLRGGDCRCAATAMMRKLMDGSPVFDSDTILYRPNQPWNGFRGVIGARAFMRIPEAYLLLDRVGDGGAEPLRDTYGTIARILPDIHQVAVLAYAMESGLPEDPDTDDILTAIACDGHVSWELFAALHDAGGVRKVPKIMAVARRYDDSYGSVDPSSIIVALLETGAADPGSPIDDGVFRSIIGAYVPMADLMPDDDQRTPIMAGRDTIVNPVSKRLLEATPDGYGVRGCIPAAIVSHRMLALIDDSTPGNTPGRAAIMKMGAWLRLAPVLEATDTFLFVQMMHGNEHEMAAIILEALRLHEDGLPLSMISEDVKHDADAMVARSRMTAVNDIITGIIGTAGRASIGRV